MKPLLTALMLGNAALFVFGALQHAGVAIGSPRKFWPLYRVTMGSCQLMMFCGRPLRKGRC
jgi:hypothetical protein